jgi:hypothetical protein
MTSRRKKTRFNGPTRDEFGRRGTLSVRRWFNENFSELCFTNFTRSDQSTVFFTFAIYLMMTTGISGLESWPTSFSFVYKNSTMSASSSSAVPSCPHPGGRRCSRRVKIIRRADGTAGRT